jgi:D-glycero-beta-D-manno-heptose 1-phosphate adenylyltransferase
MAELLNREDLIAQRERWRSEGKKVVFTNGCYDILHPGHVRLLERARSLGDVLVLALNTDGEGDNKRVRREIPSKMDLNG